MKAKMAKGVCVLALVIIMLGLRCCQGEVISIMEELEEGGGTNNNNNHRSTCQRGAENYDKNGGGGGNEGGNYGNYKGGEDNDENVGTTYRSVLGDGGMREERVRVALESWNFCNKVGNEGPNLPSPRLADCSQILCSSSSAPPPQYSGAETCQTEHLVKMADNELKSGQAFPQGDFIDYIDPDEYAVQKELYLASLCETKSEAGPWHFWMIMLKNGNFDINSGLCPSTAPPSRPFTLYKHHQSQISTHAITKDLFPRFMPQHSRISTPAQAPGSFPSLAHQRQELHTAVATDSFRPFTNQNQELHAQTTAKAKDSFPPFAQQHRESPIGEPKGVSPHFVSQHQQSHMSKGAGAMGPFPSHQQAPASATAKAKGSFPCFGPGCMNHPRIYHNLSTIQGSMCTNASDAGCKTTALTLSGSFYGTYDLEEESLLNHTISPNSSYFLVDWSKDPQSGSWLFHHVLRVNHKYPWLMLYLRADATYGFSGGYPWETRGMMIKVPESPNFKVKLTLNVLQGGGSASQFYLLDIGGCWKNDGTPCDGNTSTDVTRYSEMIINPHTDNWCRPNSLSQCPPYHVDAKTGRRIYRNDTAHFPYGAYHLYCVPPNAQFAERPYSVCDPYSNPQPQELMQLLPHPEWAVHGYPSTKGIGWVGDPKTWTLDVGGLSQRLYFYQDPNTTPAPRKWTSIDVGTEIYISQQPETAEWIVSDFDVLTLD